MRRTVLTGVTILAATMTIAACSSGTKEAQPAGSASAMTATSAMSSAMPAMPMAARSGMFQGLNDKHVVGTAKVSDNQLEVSGYSSDAGPDLHVYLTNGTDEAAVAAGKEVAKIDADKASQTFSLTGVDVAKYSTVVIHCDKAKAVFGAAALT